MPAIASPTGYDIQATATRDTAIDDKRPRPIYTIAHMVLSAQGMKDALSNGANSIEIDLTAWDEWFADHDGTGDSAGDTARDLFQAVADERKSGRDIPFVWLDIKNPDECASDDEDCGIETLRDICREILQPAGVRVLYGFFQTEDSTAYRVISESLNDNEAVVLSGEANEVLDMYSGSSFPTNQKIMDYGWTQLEEGFGDCHEDSYYTCTELRQAAEERDRGNFGKVFGWTSTTGDGSLVGSLLGNAAVDGIIYGFEKTRYYDHEDSRAAAKDITDWVEAHTDDLRMATNSDIPW
ncbi:hypothetical protein FQN54_000589 [Arachnomyces sp. PD_36]|nr:hypothetical protein FQN54_000589 [Arachnomyces sp. PD_36]